MIGTVARRTLAATARPVTASSETIAASSQRVPRPVRRACGTSSDRRRGCRAAATWVTRCRGRATGRSGTRAGLRTTRRMGLACRRAAARRWRAVGCAVGGGVAGWAANRIERGLAVARGARGAATRRAVVGGTGATVRCIGRGTTVSAPREADEDRPCAGAAADGAGSAGAGAAGSGAGVTGADAGPAGVLAGTCPLAGAGTAGAGAGAAAAGGAAGSLGGGDAEPTAGSSVSGSRYPCGSAATRMPRCRYGWASSGSPDGPTVPTESPSTTVEPSATVIVPR